MGKPAAAYALLLGVAGACRVSQDPLVACAAPGNPLGLGPALDDACAAELSSLEQQQLVPQSTPRLPGAAGTRDFIADLAPRRLAPDDAKDAGPRTLPPHPSLLCHQSDSSPPPPITRWCSCVGGSPPHQPRR